MSLQDILKEKESTLYGRYRTLETQAQELLPRIYIAHPTFTGHDVKHSLTIIKNLNKLLLDKVKDTLTPYEIFFILSAAFYHDIGMIASLNECDTEEKRKVIRDAHHIRSKDFINNNYLSLGLTKAEALILADICYAHRKVNIEEEIKDRTIGIDNHIRMRLLCSCIMLADELDITAERAPEILMNILNLNNLSLQHFKKHIETIGIDFNESDGLIKLIGVIKSENDKKLLIQMHAEIQKKLNSISKIFSSCGLPWKSVVLEADEKDLLKVKVYLYLSHYDEFKIEVVAKEYKKDEHIIKALLRDAIDEGVIYKISSSDKYTLTKDYTYYQKYADIFIGSDYELEFVRSQYSQSCIKEFLFNYIESTYDFSFDLGEKEDRETILINSPTALKNILDGTYPKNTGILTIKPILDLAIIQGYLIDLFKYPEIGCHNVRLAAETILWQIKKEIPSLSNLLSSISIDKEKDDQDVWNDIIKLQTVAPNEPPKYNINVKLKHSANFEPHLSFPRLYKAALMSGEKLEIDGHHIDEIKVTDAEGKVTLHDKPSKMAIVPNKKVPKFILNEGMSYFRMVHDIARKKLSLYMDTDRSLDLNKYPFYMVMKLSSENNLINITFDVNPFCSISDYLFFNSSMTQLTNGEIRRIAIYDDKTNMKHFENIATNFNRESSLPEERIKFFNIIKKCQQLTILSFHFVQYLPNEYCLEILKESKNIEIRNEEEANKFITKYSQKNKVQITIYRVTSFFDTGKFYVDEYFGPFVGLIIPPKIKINRYKNFNEKIKFEKEITDRAIDWKVTRLSNLDIDTLKNIITSHLREHNCLPDNSKLINSNTTEYIPKSFIEIEVSSLRESFSLQFQIVQVRIRYSTANEQLRLFAEKEYRDKNYDNSLEKYIEIIKNSNEDSEVNGMIGWLYYLKGDIDHAEEYTVKAIENNKDISTAFAHYNFGLINLKRRNYKESKEAYAVALSMDKGDILKLAIDDINDLLATDTQLAENDDCKEILEKLKNEVTDKPKKIGRNRPCPCGSGKKYKKCCGQ